MYVCKLKEDNSVRDACSTADATGCCNEDLAQTTNQCYIGNVTLAIYAMGDKKYRTGRYCYIWGVIYGEKLI